MYVQIIAELGFVGAFFYGLFITDILRTNRRILRHVRSRASPNALLMPLALATTAACYSMLVTGIFAHSGYRFSWFLFAALTVVSQRFFEESVGASDKAQLESTTTATSGPAATKETP
jgi:O-antigen ligase